MPDGLLLGVAVVLVLTLVVGLARVVRGPGTRDRLLALLLLSTTGVAILVLLAEALGVPALRDAALALVALATLIVVVHVAAGQEQA